MDAVKLVIPVSKLMGSEVLVGARVCSIDGEGCESDGVSPFSCPKVDDCSSLAGDRGTSDAAEPYSWTKKADTEQCRTNSRLSRLTMEDASQGLNHGITSSGTALISGLEGKQIQRKAGKFSRNGSGSFKKPRIMQTDNLLHHPEANQMKTESDMAGSHLMKCSNADKSQAVKQKNNINGKRGDRRNSKAQVKAKNDSFSVKAGMLNFSPASGGSNTFGMYGLKPEVHDITKVIEDISLDQLLDGSYKCPTASKDKGKKQATVNENVLDSVRKACSLLRLLGLQQDKQTEEVDIHVDKKISLISSSSNINVVNGSDGEESSLAASSSKCSKDQGSCNKPEAPIDMKDGSFYQPKEIFERLALPPPRDLDSLLQDTVKPAASVKPNDSRFAKPLSHRVSLPSFPWSHNFNGHYKSSNDATKTSNKSTCQGRWVRVRSTASFTGEGGTEGFVDMDSLTYDDTLVPAGQLKYRLPEIEKNLSTLVNQRCSQQDLSSAVGSMSSLPPHENGSTLDSKMDASSHSPRALAAAQILYDIANSWMKPHSNGIQKWPKQPSQKAMKARKSRSSEKLEEGLLTPKSEQAALNHAIRVIDYGASSSKKPKISVIERREDFRSHTHTVIGLCSVSAPRSNRSSPNRLSRDPITETRNSNGSSTKPSFVVPPLPRVHDRSNHNPQKLRKVGTMDWNKRTS